MNFDLRWLLEFLKVGPWQLLAIAAACAVLLYLNHIDWLPPLDPWMVQLCVAVMVITGFLWFATASAKVTKFAQTKLADHATAKKRNTALLLAVDTLNPSEIDFLKEMVTDGHNTYQLNPFTAGRLANFVHLVGVCDGLRNKGIVTVSAADREGKSLSVTITRDAWPLLKQKFGE